MSVSSTISVVPAATAATQWKTVSVRLPLENTGVRVCSERTLSVYGGRPPCQVNVPAAHCAIGGGVSISSVGGADAAMLGRMSGSMRGARSEWT